MQVHLHAPEHTQCFHANKEKKQRACPLQVRSANSTPHQSYQWNQTNERSHLVAERLHHNKIFHHNKILEGVIWGQKWYGSCMPTGQVALTGKFQAQLWYVDSNAAELETYQLGPPASAAAAWTLLFEQPNAVSDQPAHQTEWCLVFWSPYNK